MRGALTLLLLPLVAGASPPKKPVPPPVTHQLSAELARATAVQQLQVNRAQDALAQLDEALRVEPDWGELYFIRADAHGRLAGADSTQAALATARAGVDYETIAQHLEAAASDLEQYLRLTPDASDRSLTIKAFAELKVRSQLASEAREKQRRAAEQKAAAQKLASEEAALTSSGRIKIDGQHWCFPNQVWANERCVGVPTCRGMMVASGETCVDSPCKMGMVRVQGGRCCWPGQLWHRDRFAEAYMLRYRTSNRPTEPIHLWVSPSVEQLGCAGVPRCPEGTVKPDASNWPVLAETCMPRATRVRAPNIDEQCEDNFKQNKAGVRTPQGWRYDETPLYGHPAFHPDAYGPRVEDMIRQQAEAIGCQRNGLDYCCP